jgi:exopolysaccharide production protein ExoY
MDIESSTPNEQAVTAGRFPADSTQANRNRGFHIIKRAVDITGSAVGLIVLLPLLLAIMVMIKINDPGKVIYRRVCVGKHGRKFFMYKFRTMIENAEEKTELFSSEALARHLEGDKTIEDPRITKIGKRLRRLSLDELPQLYSVLRGTMSLVGPRPVVEREAEEYGENKDLLLSVKPGITGWWQVKGRQCCPYLSDEAKAMQLYYTRHQSLLLDVKILFLTAKVLILRKDSQ